MHEVLVNRLGGLSLPRKSVVRLTDRPDMTLDVYRGRKTTLQQPFSAARSISRFSGLSYENLNQVPSLYDLVVVGRFKFTHFFFRCI